MFTVSKRFESNTFSTLFSSEEYRIIFRGHYDGIYDWCKPPQFTVSHTWRHISMTFTTTHIEGYLGGGLSVWYITSIQHNAYKFMMLLSLRSQGACNSVNIGPHDLLYFIYVVILVLHYLGLWLDPHQRGSHCVSLSSTLVPQLEQASESTLSVACASSELSWHSARTTYWFSPHPLTWTSTPVFEPYNLPLYPHGVTHTHTSQKTRYVLTHIRVH